MALWVHLGIRMLLTTTMQTLPHVLMSIAAVRKQGKEPPVPLRSNAAIDD